MAGYLNFQTGQVLTAAQVNGFLMEQATMTFADDAARTTALASVLREGLLTYNLDTNRLEVYDGTAWVEPAPEPPAGIGSNVVQTVKTDTFTTTSATPVTVTGLTATITPSSDSAKILIVAQLSGGLSPGSNDEAAHFILAGGNVASYIGDATSGKVQSTVSWGPRTTTSVPNPLAWNATISFLDSPATVSPVTYSVEAFGQSVFVNRTGFDGTNAPRTTSSITVIEVAA